MAMTEEDKEDIKTIVREANKEQMADFYVEREQHYQHHEFIKRLMDWSDRISNTAVRSIVHAIIIFILGLILLGFFVYGGKH